MYTIISYLYKMMRNAMKNFWAAAAVFLAAFLLFAETAGAQATITTKKKKIADFETRTTKMVLAGNDMFNLSFKNEVARRWRVSPYEFISTEEYETVKSNPNYYFLMPMDCKFRKESEPGLTVLSLFKGGTDDTRIEVISFPISSSSSPSGRELVLLPAVIDIIQEYALDAVKSDMVGYAGLDSFPVKIGKALGKAIYFSRDDISDDVAIDDSWSGKGIHVVSEDEADEIFSKEDPDALVSFVIAPAAPEKNSICYKLIVDAGTHEVYYLKKHKIGPACKTGFQAGDMSSIAKMKKK